MVAGFTEQLFVNCLGMPGIHDISCKYLGKYGVQYGCYGHASPGGVIYRPGCMRSVRTGDDPGAS